MSDILKSSEGITQKYTKIDNGVYAKVIGIEGATGFDSFIKSNNTETLSLFNVEIGNGDIVYTEGSTGAANYLCISKSPLYAGSKTKLESRKKYHVPFDCFLGAMLSQRTLGQSFSYEIGSGTPVYEGTPIAISSITQTTTTLTITTATNHNLVVGDPISVFGCSNAVANYPAIVVASIVSPTQFTVTAGPMGTITSQTITNPAGDKGFIVLRDRLQGKPDGLAQIFENTTATNSSYCLKTGGKKQLPSGTIAGNHSITCATTAPFQLVNSAYQYAFAPSSEYRISISEDKSLFSDTPVDSTGQSSSRISRVQTTPDSNGAFSLSLVAINEQSLTVPSAKIVRAVKTGTTTATITTETPHGLVAGDPVVVYGIRDQAAASFPNLTTATSVASAPTTTTFTIVIGTASTVTSYGGYVAKVQGGNLMSALGGIAQVAQSSVLSTLSDGTRQLVVTGSGSWSGLSIGDLCEIYGMGNNTDGATLGVDGAWKVANVVTTTLTLVLPYSESMVLPVDFGSTNCGGGVIKRTCFRVSYLRTISNKRIRTESKPAPNADASQATAVSIMNTASVQGNLANDAALSSTGQIFPIGIRGVNSNPSAVSASADAVYPLATMIGAQIQKPYSIPEVDWQYTGALTTTGDVAAKAAAGAGIKNHVTMIQATNTGGVANDLIVKDNTTTRLQITIPAGQSIVMPLPTGIVTTANQAINVALGAAGTVRVNILGVCCAMIKYQLLENVDTQAGYSVLRVQLSSDNQDVSTGDVISMFVTTSLAQNLQVGDYFNADLI